MGAEEQGEGAFNGGLKKWAQDVILFGRKKVGRRAEGGTVVGQKMVTIV